MIQKYWGQPGCLCLHYIKRTNDGAPLPDSSAIFQRMKKGLCTNAYFSLTRQPPFNLKIIFSLLFPSEPSILFRKIRERFIKRLFIRAKR